MKKYLFLIVIFSRLLFAQNYVADFALYDPDYEDDGVWEEEVAALKAMFFNYNWSFKTIDHNDINNGELGDATNRRYKALIAPGGWAAYREVAVNNTGENNIRNFINSGGNYVGFCAGAYWASDIVDWAQTATGGGGTYNQESDYQNYDYHLDLLDASAKGPFGWTPWNSGDTASFQIAKINTANPTMNLIELPDTTRFFYYGGPFFTDFSSTPDNYEIWASAVVTGNNNPQANIGENEPTVIKFNYGTGNVILFSYHPEILIGSEADNIKLTQFVNEDSISWDVGNQTLDEINLQSWNIVHAALQIANNESVTKITTLPVIASLKVFLEGPYNSLTGLMNTNLNSEIPLTSPYPENIRTLSNIPTDIVDWVLVQLRETATGNAVASKSVLLNKNGNIVRDDGTTNTITLNAPANNYFIVIKHRNHLGIMSRNKIGLNSNTTTLYDFTIGSEKYYGTNGAKKLN